MRLVYISGFQPVGRDGIAGGPPITIKIILLIHVKMSSSKIAVHSRAVR